MIAHETAIALAEEAGAYYAAGTNPGTVYALSAAGLERLCNLVAAHLRKAAEPVAEVNSAHGDPERFGERRVDVLLSDKAMLKIPYGTKLYPHPPDADKLLQQALEYAKLMKLYGPALGYGNTTIDDHIAAIRTYLEGKK